jgi:hypothetical protein
VCVQAVPLKKFFSMFCEARESLQIGDPLDEETTLGPSHRKPPLLSLLRQVNDAVAHGAKLPTGGKRVDRKRSFIFTQPTFAMAIASSSFLVNSKPPRFPTHDPNYRMIRRGPSRFLHYYFYIRDPVIGPLAMCIGACWKNSTTAITSYGSTARNWWAPRTRNSVPFCGSKSASTG